MLNISVPLPFAKGTRSDCYLYINGGDLDVDTEYTGHTSKCSAAAAGWQITVLELNNWNPSLKVEDASCSFDPKYSYCISAYNLDDDPGGENEPSGDTDGIRLPMRDGTLKNCTKYDDVDGSRTCQQLLDANGITMAQFYAWNTEVGRDCQGLWPKYSYCVANSGHEHLPGTTKSTVNSAPTRSIPPTVSHTQIQETGTSTFRPTQTNPSAAASFNTSVSVPTTFASSVSEGPSSTPANTIATKTQAKSMPSNCVKYAKAESGDNCTDFAKAHGISASDLYAWNLVLGPRGAECDVQFFLGYYYCVGVAI